MLPVMAEPFDDIEAAYQEIGRDLFGSDDLRTDLAQRDPDEAAFFTLVLVDSEIDNGGFSQLFTNSTGDLTEEAVRGAERFGLPEHAELLRAASAELFPDGVALDQETRFGQWERLDDSADAAIESFDDRWYALDSVLEKRLHEYAQERGGS